MATHDDLPAPTEGLVLTHFITVRDVAVARCFYADIFGGEVVLEENPAIVKIANGWIIMDHRPPRGGVRRSAGRPGIVGRRDQHARHDGEHTSHG